jgi:hypothetical protein
VSTRPRFHHPPEPEPDPKAELRRTELAMRQLERAELYVVSAINLELTDPVLRRALRLLHGQVLEVQDLLRRPHVAT